MQRAGVVGYKTCPQTSSLSHSGLQRGAALSLTQSSKVVDPWGHGRRGVRLVEVATTSPSGAARFCPLLRGEAGADVILCAGTGLRGFKSRALRCLSALGLPAALPAPPLPAPDSAGGSGSGKGGGGGGKALGREARWLTRISTMG